MNVRSRVLALLSLGALVALVTCAAPRVIDRRDRHRESTDAPSTPPSLSALRERLAAHAALRFDAAARERGCPADQSLGEYLAMLQKFGSEGDLHRFEGGCSDFAARTEKLGIDPPEDPAFWFCRIESFTSDRAGDSPWHYELRLRVRRQDGAPDLGTLACPGAS